MAEAVADKAGRIHMLDASGRSVTVPQSDVQKALQSGFALQTPDQVEREEIERERSTITEQVKTAGEGALRGATLGLSDVALTGTMGEDYRKAAQERRQVNPGVSAVGEVGGAIAPLALSGGTAGAGLAARGARAVGAPTRAVVGGGRLVEQAALRGLQNLGFRGTSLASRAARRGLASGAAGAAEGAAYGLGHAVSESALSGDQITAEKVVASMKDGALLGGVFSGGLGGGGVFAGAGVRKIAGKLRRSAKQLASNKAIDATGARGSDFRRLVSGKGAEQAKKKLNNVGQDLLEYELKTGPNAGKRIVRGARNANDMLDDVAQARRELGAQLGAVRSKVDDVTAQRPELAPDLGAYLDRVDTEILAPLRASDLPWKKNLTKRVEKQLKTLRDKQRARQDAMARGEVPEPVKFADLETFRRDLSERVYPEKPPSGGLPAPPPKAVKQLERAERLLSDHLDDSVERALAESGQDVGFFKQLKRKYSSFRDLEDIALKAHGQGLGNRSVSPSDYATGLASFMGMAMSGNVGALVAGTAGAVGHKMLRERGNTVLAQLAQKISKFENNLDDGARALAGLSNLSRSSVVRGSVIAENLSDSYEQAAQAIEQLAQSPELMSEHVGALTEDMAEEKAQLAQGVGDQLRRTVAYLEAERPKPTVSSSLTPQLSDPRVAPHDMREFLSKVRGATDPESVIEDLKSGKIDRDAIEAMKALHPETFSQLRNKVIQYTSELEEPLPFKRRNYLSLVFDFKSDWSMQPENLSEIQAVGSSPEEKPGPAPGQPLPDDLSSQMQTPSQKSAIGA